MRVSRIQFDDSEPTDNIARRIACAFDPGNILRIRGEFFKMSSLRVMNQTSENNVVGGNYTLILNPGEPIPEGLLKAQAPPPVVVEKPEKPEEADWDDEPDSVEATAAEPEPEPIVPEPIKVLVEPEPEPLLESVPPPPTSEVFLSRPPPSIDGKPLDVAVSNETTTNSKSGEYLINLPNEHQVQVEVGQVWQSKDTRRSTAPFTVTNVDHEFVYQDNGRKIALNRMFRYKRVS